jgi:hypothetical protein
MEGTVATSKLCFSSHRLGAQHSTHAEMIPISTCLSRDFNDRMALDPATKLISEFTKSVTNLTCYLHSAMTVSESNDNCRWET